MLHWQVSSSITSRKTATFFFWPVKESTLRLLLGIRVVSRSRPSIPLTNVNLTKPTNQHSGSLMTFSSHTQQAINDDSDFWLTILTYVFSSSHTLVFNLFHECLLHVPQADLAAGSVWSFLPPPFPTSLKSIADDDCPVDDD